MEYPALTGRFYGTARQRRLNPSFDLAEIPNGRKIWSLGARHNLKVRVMGPGITSLETHRSNLRNICREHPIAVLPSTVRVRIFRPEVAP
jgi:hypothetical protein